MKPKIYIALFTTLSIILLSCKTAKKLYEKGNYDEAVELAAKKLQKDPDDPKLTALIREAYRYAEEDHQANIRNHSSSNNELKWEWIYQEYAGLQKMYNAIRKVPEIDRMLKPVDYSSYLTSFGERAGEVRFDRGLHFMNVGTKSSFRDAFHEFQAALGFRPGDRDIMQKLDESFELAVTNVVVLPIHQFAGYTYSGYRIGGYNFDDHVIRQLQQWSGNQFVRFYSAWDARQMNLRADLEVDMRMMTMDFGRFHDSRSQRQVSKQVLVKETVIRPDSIVREYATVTAQITTTRRSINSIARLDLNVREPNGRHVWSDYLDASHQWSTEFISYTGDERALDDSDRQQLKQGQQVPPHEEEIARCLLEQLSSNALHRVRNFFNGY